MSFDVALRDSGGGFDIALTTGAASYTLPAALGSFSEAGQPALTKRTGISSVGTFAESGTAAGLAVGRVALASAGTFAEAGSAALAKRTAVSSSGAFLLDGIAAGLAPGKRMPADVGAFALTGTGAAGPRTGQSSTGPFVLGGVAAGLSHARTLTAAVGAFALTGTGAAGPRTGQSAVGAFALGGTTAGFTVAKRAAADAGAFVLAGNPATAARKGLSGPAAFVLDGIAAGLAPGKRMAADVGAFTLAGSPVAAARTGLSGSGVFVLDGIAASLVGTGARVAAAVGAFVLAGADARLVLDRRLTASRGALALSVPAAGALRTSLSDPGALVLSGAAAGTRVARPLIAARGSFALLGNPALAARSGAAGTGAVLLAGGAALARRTGVSGPAAFVFDGVAAALDYAQGVGGEVGAFTIAGSAGFLVRLGFGVGNGAVLVTPQATAALRVFRRQVVILPAGGRMPFGGQERGGARGGELHPDGPGPLLEDYRDRTDVARLPWTCPRGSEWTTPAFRAQVLTWLRQLVQRRRAAWGLSGRWAVVERAQARGLGIRRLPPDAHHLVVTLRRTRGTPLEVAIPFPRAERDGAALLARLALLEGAFGAIL